MAINDVDAEAFWALAEGFAIVAKVVARNCTTQQGKGLLEITDRLQRRALLLEREVLADQFQDASDRLRHTLG